MLGFYPPTEGTVTIGRQSLQKISFKEWRKHCGVVMQEGFIFGDTIANNIVPDGNMIDRVFRKYVVDYIYFSLINFPVFNVADIYVTVAAFMLVVLILFFYQEEDLNRVFSKKKEQE